MTRETHAAAAPSHGLGARFARRDLLYLVVLAGVTLAVAWPLLQGKLTSGHDAGEYSVRLVEFERALRDGILLPRWAPDVDFGYGSPIFVFLPPLIYYLAAVPSLLGLDVINALNFAGLLILAAGGLGMYLLARDLYGPEGGLLSSIAYLLAPAFLVTLYVRHAFTDFSALAVLPFCFWAMLRLVARPGRAAFLASAVSVALLLLASYSVSLIALPVLCLRPLFALVPWRAPGRGLLGFAAIAVGSLLSGFAWLPALLERSFVHAERLLQGESYAYANHFVYPSQLLSSPWGYGISQPGPRDGFSFELGPVHLALAVVGLLGLVRARNNAGPLRVFVLWMAVALAYACLMSIDVTRPIWDSLLPLQYLQFPWRFLVLAAFALSALAGLAAANLSRYRPEPSPLPAVASQPRAPASVTARGGVVAESVMGWGSGLLRAMGGVDRSPGLPAGMAVAGVALLLLEGLPHAQPQELYAIAADEFTPQSIARRSLPATDADEYQPVQVAKTPDGGSPPLSLYVQTGLATVHTQRRLSHQIIWTMDTAAGARVSILIFYYPGWYAYADGAPIALSVQSGTGLMLADIPARTHEFMLHFEDSPQRNAAQWFSLLGLLFLALALWRLPATQ